MKPLHLLTVLAVSASLSGTASAQPAPVPDWPAWRGPGQQGTSPERYEGWEGIEAEPVWTHEAQGKGTPVIAGGRLFSFNYTGETEDAVEWLTALDARTGEVIWKSEFRDFISDTVYNRYSIGSPAVDPETRDVYLMTANGTFRRYTFDGELKWEISMMERFGRLTFPNGRAGAPVVEGDLVIVRGITAYWGAEGPAADRFFGFDKVTGDLVWSCTPGVQPQDSSFATPVVETRYGQRVFYSGTGCGNVVCINARNGKPLWRFQLCHGGVNSTPLLYGDTVIAIHGVENIDTSEEGRMVAIRMPESVAGAEQALLGPESEQWRNPLTMFTSSGVLVGDRVYQLTKTGTLACVDAKSGEVLWDEKLAADNLHSSPLWADGVLYVPMSDGVFHVIRPSDAGPEALAKIQLEGSCLGAPVIWNGHLYVHSTKRLYCFKIKHSALRADPVPVPEIPEPGEAVALQVVPNDVLLSQGATQDFRVRRLDAAGFVAGEVPAAEVAWESFIPPTARVRATLDAAFNSAGQLVAAADAKSSAGAFKGTAGALSGTVRGRVLPAVPYREDFESFELAESAEDGSKFAYPPLSWIGARFKFDIREDGGNKSFAKTLDRVLFQRATAFFGGPEMSGYTLAADVMTEGDRRKKMDVGLVNQRYAIILKGNYNQIEVSSNFERLTRSVPFAIKANTWYRLVTRVGREADGSGFVRAKAWERGGVEPEGWSIEVPLDHVHANGAPGIFGFALQNQKKVYVDNIELTSNPDAATN